MLTAFGLIAIAELGDKSQLVCLALSSRYRPGQVVLGAVLAFSVLNALAVLAGGTLAATLPETPIRVAAALLFAAMGILAIRSGAEEDDDDDVPEETPSGRSPILATAALLALAELGDKTQIAVATLATVESPVGVWLGATLALTTTSALAAWAGGWLLPRLPRAAHDSRDGAGRNRVAGGTATGEVLTAADALTTSARLSNGW